MELFRMEHKKLWRKASVKACVLVCFSYMAIFGSVLSFEFILLRRYSGEGLSELLRQTNMSDLRFSVLQFWVYTSYAGW